MKSIDVARFRACCAALGLIIALAGETTSVAAIIQPIFDFPLIEGRPEGQLFSDGTSLYGVATLFGSVYSIGLDGSNYQTLHSFTGQPLIAGSLLALDDNRLLGITLGGTPTVRTTYSLNKDGSDFQTLQNASFHDPLHIPMASTGTQVIGSTPGHHSNPAGSLFVMNADGSGFQTTHSFGTGAGNGQLLGGLTLFGSKVYGTLQLGGVNNAGAIFTVDLDGSNFQIIHSAPPAVAGPAGRLVESGGVLYGMTSPLLHSTSSIFSINPDGTGFTPLRLFEGISDAPTSIVVLDDTILGTTREYDLFSMNLDGSGFQILTSRFIIGPLTSVGSTAYAVSNSGGIHGGGVLYAITVPEPSSALLAGAGLAALSLAACRRRRHARQRAPESS